MRAAFDAIIAWVVVSLLLRYAVDIQGWPVGLTGTLSRAVTLPVLALWILARGDGWRRLRPRGKGRALAVMGVISIALNLLWFAALKWTTAANFAMLIRMDIVFIALIGAMLGVERITKVQLVLMPVMLVGLGLLTEVHRFDVGGHLLGDSMVVLAALGLAVNAFIIRGIMESVDAESVALYNHAISAIGFVVVAVWNGEFALLGAMVETRAAWATLVLLGVGLALQLPLYYVALGRMELWKLRLFFLLTPVLTAAAESALWGVELTRWQLAGAAIILGALAVLIRLEARAGAQDRGKDGAVM